MGLAQPELLAHAAAAPLIATNIAWKRCQEPFLTVRSERTPGAAGSPENWDWKAHYGLEDAQ